MTTSVHSQTTVEANVSVQKRGCLFYVKRSMKWLGIALIVLVVVLGASYQAVATETDRHDVAANCKHLTEEES